MPPGIHRRNGHVLNIHCFEHPEIVIVFQVRPVRGVGGLDISRGAAFEVPGVADFDVAGAGDLRPRP